MTTTVIDTVIVDGRVMRRAGSGWWTGDMMIWMVVFLAEVALSIVEKVSPPRDAHMEETAGQSAHRAGQAKEIRRIKEMKALVLGTAIAGVALLGFRAAARHGRRLCAEHCGAMEGPGPRCG